MERLGVTATCRASFAMYNTKAEVDALVDGADQGAMTCLPKELPMDGKQIEDREVLKTAVEALDAPPTCQPTPARRRKVALLPPLKLRGLCRLRKSTG